jgi:hypothetical protein
MRGGNISFLLIIRTPRDFDVRGGGMTRGTLEVINCFFKFDKFELLNFFYSPSTLSL